MQVVPLVPPPTPAARPETYSVVVNNVRVQDLLFALARDAKLNVDIHPGVTGSVTLNAIDQTLPQLLGRIARQVDMRYEIDGQTLSVMRDTPYLRIYRVDYINMIRDSKSEANLSTQVSGTVTGGAGTGGGGISAAGNNSTSTVKSTSVSKFWDSLVGNIQDLLRETDKIIPAAGAAPARCPRRPARRELRRQPQQAQPTDRVPRGGLGDRERRNRRPQHPRDLAPAREGPGIPRPGAGQRQAPGADRGHRRRGAAQQQLPARHRLAAAHPGLRRPRLFPDAPRAAQPAVNPSSFIISFATGGRLDITGTLKLLESFGDVRVLSSPKLSVLNNQTASLKVVDNLVYFTVTANTVAAANSPSITTFNTTVNSVPVGFIMSVTPQISENDSVLLNIRPTISRKLTDVSDPNPSLANPCGTPMSPAIPVAPLPAAFLRLRA